MVDQAIGQPNVQRAWSSPWWRRSATLALIWSALLVYGGLIPFDLSWPPTVYSQAYDSESIGSTAQVIGYALTKPLRWYVYREGHVSSWGLPEWLSDGFLNAAIFFPLGVMWMLALRPRLGFNAGLGVSVMLAGLLSWGIETGQAFSVARVSALNDVLVNTGAAAAGAVLALPARRMFLSVSLLGYALLTPVVHRVADGLRVVRRDPALRSLFVGGVVLLGLLVTVMLARVVDTGGGEVPLAGVWERSYEVGASQMVIAVMGYGLVGLLAVALVVKPKEQQGWKRVLLVAGLLAFGYEVVRATVLGVRMDFTLALMAVGSLGLVMAMSLGLIHAVRLACRRRESSKVEADRRRRSHDYSFRIGT
ncbi:MAG: VanZ family protein [Phycisphaeraceae bacterium]